MKQGKSWLEKNKLDSYENRCKAVLEYLSNTYMPFEGEHKGKYVYCLNRAIRDEDESAIYPTTPSCFYIQSCEDCEYPCEFGTVGSLKFKANNLYTRLPVFISNANLEQFIGRNFIAVSRQDMEQKTKATYDKLRDYLIRQYKAKHPDEQCNLSNLEF